LSGYDRLAKLLRIPLASGETFSADRLIRDYIAPRRLPIVQPDLDTVGLTGGHRISQLCALNNIRLVPHNWGTAVRTLGDLPRLASFRESDGWRPLIESDQTENPLREAVVARPPQFDPADGCIAVPDGPGLGVEVVPEAVSQFRRELTTID